MMHGHMNVDDLRLGIRKHTEHQQKFILCV